MSRIISLSLMATFLCVSLWPSTKAVAKLPAKSKAHHTSKLTAPMNVRVELSGPAPTQTGDEYNLVGIVVSGKAVKSVKLQWELGNVASLVAGALSQTVDLEPGKEIRTQIKVKALQLGATQVRLNATVGPSEARLSSSGRVRNPPLTIMTDSTSGKKKDVPVPTPSEEKKPKMLQ